MKQAFDEFVAIVHLLLHDVDRCDNELHNDTHDLFALQYWRRAYARSVFTAIDGVLFHMRQVTHAFRSPSDTALSLSEVVLLLEQTARQHAPAQVIHRNANIMLFNTMQCTFQRYADALGIENALGPYRTMWGIFRKAMRTHDRLARPRSLYDLVIDDTEMLQIMMIWHWFSQAVEDMLAASTERFNELQPH